MSRATVFTAARRLDIALRRDARSEAKPLSRTFALFSRTTAASLPSEASPL